MTPKNNKEPKDIKCPFCGRKKAVIKNLDDDGIYLCLYCNKLFDLKKDN